MIPSTGSTRAPISQPRVLSGMPGNRTRARDRGRQDVRDAACRTLGNPRAAAAAGGGGCHAPVERRRLSCLECVGGGSALGHRSDRRGRAPADGEARRRPGRGSSSSRCCWPGRRASARPGWRSGWARRGVSRAQACSSATLLLLEPESARRWHDPCLIADCDLSHVNWIACANSTARLSPALRSRFQVIELDWPSAEDFDAALGGVMHDFATGLD